MRERLAMELERCGFTPREVVAHAATNVRIWRQRRRTVTDPWLRAYLDDCIRRERAYLVSALVYLKRLNRYTA